MSHLIEDLLVSIKNRSFVPISDSTFNDDDLIVIANEELRLKLVSKIMGVREDFFLQTVNQTLTSGVNHYPVPRRAIGNALKTVFLVDTSGNKRSLQRIDLERLGQWNGQAGTPQRVYFAGDEIIVVPTPGSTSDYLQLGFYAKPNALVATTSCAKITGVSSVGGTTTFTVNTDLSASLAVGSKIDFLSDVSPYLLWADRIAITAITASTIEVATSGVYNEASVVEPQVGDYICPTGYANIPMLPEEFHPVLAQMVAVRLLASFGDMNKLQLAKAQLNEDIIDSLNLVKNRLESAPERAAGQWNHLSAFTGL